MEAQTIAATLSGRTSHPPAAAVSCLLHFNDPMSALEVKNAVAEAEGSGKAFPTFTKPAQELPVNFVLQAIVAASASPFLEWSLLRSLLLEGINNKVAPFVTAAQWLTILEALSNKPIRTPRMARCFEELLKASASVLFGTGDIKKETIATWSGQADRWIRASAALFSSRNTRDMNSELIDFDDKRAPFFLKSPGVRRFGRTLQTFVKAVQFMVTDAKEDTPFALWAVLQAVTSTSGGLDITNHKIPASVVDSAFKLPRCVRNVLSENTPRGAISLEKPEDVFDDCLISFGQVATTLQGLHDICALFAAVHQDVVVNFFSDGQKLRKLIAPITSNPKLFSYANLHTGKLAATVTHSVSARHFPATAFESLFKLTGEYLPKTTGVQDKAACLTMYLNFLRQANTVSANAGTHMPKPPQLQTMLRVLLNNASPEIALAAWSILAEVKCHKAMDAVIQPILKSCLNNEAQRRAVLLSLPHDFGSTTLSTKLVKDAPDTETYQADAVLCLKFLSSAERSKVAKEIVNPTTVAAIASDETGAEQLVEVAKEMLLAGDADLFALLLSHRNGTIRSKLYKILHNDINTAAVITSLFESYRRLVFGLEQGTTAAPVSPLCQGTTSWGLRCVGAKVLAILNSFEGEKKAQILADVLLMAGSDISANPKTSDPTFFELDCSMEGKYRDFLGLRISKWILSHLFRTNSAPQLSLEENVEGVLAILSTEILNNEAPHRARSAVRAFAALSALATDETAALVATALQGAVEVAVRKYSSLSALDLAIASGNLDEVEAYIESALNAKGLIKDHGVRPPKGMSQDDWEYQIEKDTKALNAGRVVEVEAVEKRKEEISATLTAVIAPFTAFRIAGRQGNEKATNSMAIALPQLFASAAAHETLPTVVNSAVSDSITAILSGTPLGPFAGQLVALIRRISSPKYCLLTPDVSEILSLTARLRANLTKIMHPLLFPALVPITRAVFLQRTSKASKAVPIQALVQLLTIFVTNCTQPGIPLKADALLLLITILKDHATMYKTISSAVHTMVSYTSEVDIANLLKYALVGVELVRETCTSALRKFQHFDILRKAAVVISAASYDAKTAISSAATAQMEQLQFQYDSANDWPLFLELLKEHKNHQNGITQVASALGAMLLQFPDSQEENLGKVFEVGGMSAVVTIRKICERLNTASQVKAAHFLVDVSEDGNSDAYLMELTLNAGKRLIAVASDAAISEFGDSLIPRLKKPVQGTTKEHKEDHNAITVTWLSAIALRSKATDQLIASMDQQTTMLNVSDSALVHSCVCECMSDISGNALMKGHPKVDDFAQNSLKQIFQSGSYARKKAHSYGLVGVIYGLGMNSLRRFDVVNQIINACGDKVVPRSGAMALIESCADSLGYGFEPYSLQLIDHVLSAVGDKDARVSEVAEDAAKAIMRSLSDIGLRQLVPKLVAGLDADQTKKKVSALGFIGYIAFCSPKQLAAALPRVIPSITDCISDVNTTVANAAFAALKRVAGVVSNPEIQEHVEDLLRAMRAPGSETENALDGLLYTRFTNVVDPASLALIIPIINRGLAERLHTTRGKACQIVASMVALVKDTRSLLPYAEELMKKLQTAALDPMNEVRTTASRAISLLVSTLRGKFIDSTVDWTFATLRRATTSAEKSGAAQVLTDTVAQVGESLLVQVKDTLLEGCQDADANVREGFLYVYVFAPSSLPVQMFQNFLPDFFPSVLQALSDSVEAVRDVALNAGTSIIQLHGARNKDMILGPLMEGVISENTSTRQSSMLLVAKLMVYFAQQIRKKFKMLQNAAAEEETEAPKEEEEVAAPGAGSSDGLQETQVAMDSARDAEKTGFSLIQALEEQLGTEAFCRLFAAIHVARSEHNATVRAEVQLAWQICIASPRTAINKIFVSIINMLLKFASSTVPECQDVTQRCIEYTCSRMNEAIEKFITQFASEYQKGEKKRMLGALMCIADVVPYADAPRITKMGAAIASSVMPALQDDDDEIRAAGGLVFENVGKVVGPRWIESIVETQMQNSVLGVVELVRVRATATLQVAFDFLAKKKSYSEDDMELMQYLFQIEQAESSLPKHFEDITRVLRAGELQGLTKASQALMMFADYLEPAYTISPLEDFDKLMKKPEDRPAALRCILNYGIGLKVDSVEAIEKALSLLIHTLSDVDDEIRNQAAHGFMKLASNLDQKSLDSLNDADRADEGSIKRNASKFGATFCDAVAAALGVTARSIITDEVPFLPALGIPKMLDTFQLFYNRALEHGQSNQKLVALDGLIELLNFSPTEIAHAAGPTMAAKLVKTLFLRNEGTIVNALMQLCYKIMSFPQTAKDKIVESSMASALVAGVVCDSAEARTRAHRLAILLMKRTPANIDHLLAGVSSKKNLAESTTQKTAMCRYISVLMRHNSLEKRLMAASALMTLSKTFWESEGWADLVSAAGMAVGSLCATPAISDDMVASIAEKSLHFVKSRSSNIIAGLSCLFALVTRCKARLDDDIIDQAGQALSGVYNFTTDRLTVMWCLRLTGALASFPVALKHLKADAVCSTLKRIGRTDDQLHSTGHYCIEAIKPALKQSDGVPTDTWNEFWQTPSTLWQEIGFFDADLEDEFHSAPINVSS